MIYKMARILNKMAKAPDPKAFFPIHKTKVPPSVFGKIVSRFNIWGSRFTIDEHIFQTEDGYDLLCFRIRLIDSRKWNNKVVLLNHGWSGSSDCWFLHNESIGMYFVRKGYDVWA